MQKFSVLNFLINFIVAMATGALTFLIGRDSLNLETGSMAAAAFAGAVSCSFLECFLCLTCTCSPPSNLHSNSIFVMRPPGISQLKIESGKLHTLSGKQLYHILSSVILLLSEKSKRS